MPPRHPSIAHALGLVRRRLAALGPPSGPGSRRRVHVACSGGADSVALLGLLHAIADRDALRLSVGHVDHGLRPESGDEAARVASIAERLGLPFAVDRLELAAGPGLPARARDARLAALREQAAQQGARVVALGHTATDQAETVLLHLCRGAGLPGLAAMDGFDPWPRGGGGWLRALLDLDRGQTRELATLLQLPFVDDPTNDDPRHPRVRVRHQVLGLLRELNPKVELALARAALHAREAEDALAAWVATELAARTRSTAAPGEIRDESGAALDARPAHTARAATACPAVTSGSRWSTEGMEHLPMAVRKRLVRTICRAAGVPDDGMSAQTLASIDDALVRPGPARTWDLAPRLRLHLHARELWMDSSEPRASRGQPLTP
ncbi:MAG: tRNA lysidine(34) synthetase TilS [Myxococcales bacterium]|nr:tRNA lysidine(34) synthetase TilS [Myxococcales bacterium]